MTVFVNLALILENTEKIACYSLFFYLYGVDCEA